VGLSYGTFRESALTPSLDGSAQEKSFEVKEAGATVVQTVAPGLVLGSTVKYVRGRLVSGSVAGSDTKAALDDAAKLDGPSSGEFDFDLGAMADLGVARLGLVVRNLREPVFHDAVGSAITLKRHARAGLAVMPAHGLTLAMDLDLDTAALWDGPRRILAVGGEDRFGQRWALRGGVRWSLEGARRTTASIGASLAVRRSFWLDWQYTQGHLDADRGFSIALRAGS
jgi:hypothetical protein